MSDGPLRVVQRRTIRSAERRLYDGGFNGSMQHTRDCVSRRSVADEAKTEDLLHGKSEILDVGALA
jgi:hypothetical protein